MESASNDHRHLTRIDNQASRLASPAEVLAFQDALLRLLERRAAIYTQGDSTSLPAHTAVELLRSVCFVLGIDPEGASIPRRLLNVDLEQEYGRRLTEIEGKVKSAMQLWCDVSAMLPPIPNIALADTITEIGRFFENYDHRSMAHDIPCMIDYPLCHPVDETLPGIDYIREYLRNLMTETCFLRRFEISRCERVLSSASPDHVGLLLNLFEPVATNAIGLALIDEDPRKLEMDDGARSAIAERLARALGDTRQQALRSAATAVCEVLGIAEGAERAYLHALVPELLPRVDVALFHNSLGGVFVG